MVPGKYQVAITWGGYAIPRSPFEVQVAPEAGAQKVRAWGPGLEGGVVGKSADFVVEAIGTEVGTLGFSIEGPSQARIEDSPFIAHILPAPPDSWPEKVKAFGPGLEPSGCIVDRPAEFTIDARGAGKGPLKLYAQDAEGFPIDIKVKDNGDGTFHCVYVPTKAIKHTIIVTWGGVNTPRSPFRVLVGEGSHPGRVKVYGPGVEKTGLKANEPTYFTVDCSEAGQGDVSIGIKCAPGVVGPVEADIDFDIIKNDNDTFTVKYTPPGAGLYTIMVLFANQEIPSSPFRIKVEPSHDASKVKAEGPGLSRTGVEVGKPTHFTVQTKGAGKAPLEVQFGGAGGQNPPVRDFEVIDNHDYSYTVKYTPTLQGPLAVVVTYGGDPVPKSPFPVTVAPPLQLGKVKVQGLNSRWAPPPPGAPTPSPSPPPEEGPYRVEVTYDGHPLPGSPFPVEAQLPPDPAKVCAYGPGLQGGPVGVPAPFTIDTKGAGTGGLGLTVEGPCEAKIECQDNGDGSCAVSYLPTAPGDYNINILFAERHIPGSPFKAKVTPVFDPTKVTASGPGLERGKAGEVATFMVDCSEAGEAELTIEIISEAGVKAEVSLHNNRDGTYTITYTPACAGAYTITIKYGGHPVPKFPVRVTVDPAVDTSGVKVYGKGVEPRGVLREVGTDFTVDARALTKTGGPHVKARVLNPSGAKTDTYVTDHGDGTYRVDYTPYEDGLHRVEVTYDDVGVPKSPFRVGVAEGCDPTRVRAHGPGLEGGLVGKANRFTVETRGAGTGGLGLAIEGPLRGQDVLQGQQGRELHGGVHPLHARRLRRQHHLWWPPPSPQGQVLGAGAGPQRQGPPAPDLHRGLQWGGAGAPRRSRCWDPLVWRSRWRSVTTGTAPTRSTTPPATDGPYTVAGRARRPGGAAQPLQGQGAAHPRRQQGAGQRAGAERGRDPRQPPRGVHHRRPRRRRGAAHGPDPGPRGAPQEGVDPRQRGRHLRGVVRARRAGALHQHRQVRGRRDPALALPHPGRARGRRQQVPRHSIHWGPRIG
ncbi:unnamed protein product [Bubo scandiacus]